MNPDLLVSFLAATLVVQVVPGPGMLFILANGMAGGIRAGVAAAFGAATGVAIHTVAAALGLAAVLEHAPMLFRVTKLVGAAYLLWLAIDAFRGSRIDLESTRPTKGRRPSRVYVRGLLNNLANPKVILFFVAFLPQFVDSALGHVTLQFLALGGIFLLVGLGLDVIIGLTAGRVGEVLKGHPSFGRLSNWLAGTIFAGLAARLALSRESA